MQSSATLTPTQRRLILIRHAKAVEEDIGGDHARGLSEHGRADVAELAEWLTANALVPDLALCSTAARTRQTLAVVAPNVPTILSDRLYLATTGEMLAQIQATDDAVGTLLLLGHNPGAHGLAASLVGRFALAADADRLLLKFPTAACAVIDFTAPSWRDVQSESGQLALLRY